MTLALTVYDYCVSRSSDAICDACIGRGIGVTPAAANRVTHVLETTIEFTRREGVCVDCGKRQKVLEKQLSLMPSD